MLTSHKNYRCDEHPRKPAEFQRLDKNGQRVDMCNKCRTEFLLEQEILVCKHCDVLVKSEENPRAKFPYHMPHKPDCPRHVARPRLNTIEEFLDDVL